MVWFKTSPALLLVRSVCSVDICCVYRHVERTYSVAHDPSKTRLVYTVVVLRSLHADLSLLRWVRTDMTIEPPVC